MSIHFYLNDFFKLYQLNNSTTFNKINVCHINVYLINNQFIVHVCYCNCIIFFLNKSNVIIQNTPYNVFVKHFKCSTIAEKCVFSVLSL